MVVSGFSRDSLALHPQPVESWVLVGFGCSLHFGFQPHFQCVCAFVFYILSAHFLRNPTWSLGFLSSRMFVPPAKACAAFFFSHFHLSCFFHLSFSLSHTPHKPAVASLWSFRACLVEWPRLYCSYKNTCLHCMLLLFFTFTTSPLAA